jgi:hypothetical protein
MSGRGRPAREPTAAERKKVREFIGEGASRRVIAGALGVSVPTLRKLFATELGLEKKSGQVEAPFKITEQMRADVALMAACNEPRGRIAKAIGVSDEDLARFFAEDLEIGAARYRLKALNRLDLLAQAGSLGAANKLAAMTSPAEEGTPASASPVGKKAAARADAADMAASGGKFAPRAAPGAPRLAVSNGRPIEA